MLVHARKYALLSIGASLLTMALKFGAFFLTGSVNPLLIPRLRGCRFWKKVLAFPVRL